MPKPYSEAVEARAHALHQKDIRDGKLSETSVWDNDRARKNLPKGADTPIPPNDRLTDDQRNEYREKAERLSAPEEK